MQNTDRRLTSNDNVFACVDLLVAPSAFSSSSTFLERERGNVERSRKSKHTHCSLCSLEQRRKRKVREKMITSERIGCRQSCLRKAVHAQESGVKLFFKKRQSYILGPDASRARKQTRGARPNAATHARQASCIYSVTGVLFSSLSGLVRPVQCWHDAFRIISHTQSCYHMSIKKKTFPSQISSKAIPVPSHRCWCRCVSPLQLAAEC